MGSPSTRTFSSALIRSVTVACGLGAVAEVVLTGPQALHLGGGLPGDDVPRGRPATPGRRCLPGAVPRRASSAFAVTARMLLSPSGVTLIASSTFLAVQSPPSSRAVRSAAAVDLMRVAAVCAVRVGSPASRTALRPWNCVSSWASGVSEDVRGGLIVGRTQGGPRDGRADGGQHHRDHQQAVSADCAEVRPERALSGAVQSGDVRGGVQRRAECSSAVSHIVRPWRSILERGARRCGRPSPRCDRSPGRAWHVGR